MENPFEIITLQLESITQMLQKVLLRADHVPEKSEWDYLNIKEAGELIFLSIPTIYGLVSKREIPHVKRGKRLYFSRTELEEWLRKGRRKTREEIIMDAGTNILTRRKRRRR